MNFKSTLKDITPPFFWKWLRKKLIDNNRNKKGYDRRRWWYGEDLEGDNSRFSEIFNFKNLNSSISMLDNEIRDCIEIQPNKELNLDFLKSNKDKNLLFSFGNKSNQRSINGNYQIYFDEKKKIEIKNPLSSRWNNSLIENVSKCDSLKIKNNTEKILYFACPIFLENFKKENNEIKNVILIVLDQFDSKVLNELEQNPDDLKFINSFFNEEYNFENCFSAAEWTLPCFSSIFSGKHPSEHGNFDLKISEKIKNVITDDNLIDFIRREGYSTFGISKSKGHHAGYNIQKYFDRLLYFDDAHDVTVEDDFSFARKTIEHLEMNSKGKNFVYLHYMSSHSPYWKPNINEETKLSLKRFGDPLKEYNDAIVTFGDSKVEPIMDNQKVETIIARQKERIKSLDLVLGQLFTFLEKKQLKQNSIVILTADHGPNHFGEVGKPMMNRSRLNVPLKIYDFKNKTKKKIQNYVCQTDIFPMIKYFFDKEEKSNVIPPYGNKNTPIISESIFNDKYKVSIRTKNQTFYYSCKFNPQNFSIMINEKIDSRIDFFNDENKADHEKLKKEYLNILEEHLKKSQIIQIIK